MSQIITCPVCKEENSLDSKVCKNSDCNFDLSYEADGVFVDEDDIKEYNERLEESKLRYKTQQDNKFLKVEESIKEFNLEELKQSMFENVDEYKARIETLSYTTIGEGELKEYIRDEECYIVNIQTNDKLNNILEGYCNNFITKVKIELAEARQMWENSETKKYPIIAKFIVKEKLEIGDICLDKYSFIKYLNISQKKEEKRSIEEDKLTERCMNMLLDNGFEIKKDINAENNDGFTALMWASINGHFEVVKYLVENGADIENKYANRFTALMWASINGHLEVVKYLVENGADIENKSNDGNTALLMASINGYLEVVKCLVGNGANIKAKNNNKDTTLSCALYNGHLEVIRYLVDNGVDIEDRDTELIWASFRGYLEVVKYLVENGANIEAKDNGGCTALISASGEGHLEVVRYLVENGVDIEVKDNLVEETALIWALDDGHSKVVEYLKSKGAKEY